LKAAGGAGAASVARSKVDCLSRQLDASGPVLSDIADAGADEARAIEASDAAALEAARARKTAAQDALKAISAAHADEMKRLRCPAE